jgi:hypothetical protein
MIIPPFDDFIEVLTNLAEMHEVDCHLRYLARQSKLFQAMACSLLTVGAAFIGMMGFKLLNGAIVATKSPKVKPVTRSYKEYRRLLG